MKGRSDPPLPEGMQEHIVWRTTLIVMELVEQPMSWVELVGILSIKIRTT